MTRYVLFVIFCVAGFVSYEILHAEATGILWIVTAVHYLFEKESL